MRGRIRLGELSQDLLRANASINEMMIFGVPLLKINEPRY
jgi:hypothetical protein